MTAWQHRSSHAWNTICSKNYCKTEELNQSCGRVYAPNSFCQDIFFFSDVNWDGEAEAEAWPGPCSVGAAAVNDAFTAKAGEFTLQLVLFVEAQNRSSASGFGFPALTDVNLLHWQRVSSWSRWIAGVFSAFSVRETNQPSERPHVLLYLPAFVMSLRELRALRN